MESDTDFDAANFSNSTDVTCSHFPLVPGTRFTWKGHALDDDEPVTRRTEFTVTDMTKVIDGIETVVAWTGTSPTETASRWTATPRSW
ncbi:MAG: hypothetical protein OEV60_07520 [Actinomycetota bacterium]|nr:hypothetical protein [Actinomycetota bacterium]MDH5224099.1 hypothetical protein [Actinomycetota bacterium]MDH5312783.1 hypothetical protein [Actinomycetota bacterium]